MWDRHTFFNRLLSKMCAIYVSYGVQYKPGVPVLIAVFRLLLTNWTRRAEPGSGFSWRRRGVCDHRFFSC